MLRAVQTGLIPILLLALTPCRSPAQQSRASLGGVDLGWIHAQHGYAGWAAALTYQRTTPLATFTFTPVELTVIKEGNELRYHGRQVGSNDRECLDVYTASLVPQSNCDGAVLVAGSADMMYNITGRRLPFVSLGGGARFGSSGGLYGAAALTLGPHDRSNVGLKVRVGGRFVGVGATLVTPF